MSTNNVSNIEECLKGKNVLITGGTGSFGRQIVLQLVNYEPNRVVIFSRDEKKQNDMDNEFEEYRHFLEFIIGDVRDYAQVYKATKGIHIVYHAAALKQVPSCEAHPLEVVKTNILGAENVRMAAIENKVEVVITVSTDKAVKPVNVMGTSKAIQERIMLDPNNGKSGVRFVCVRYGNVLGSRGSVVPLFKQRIQQGKYLPITHPDMTRFLLTLDEAIELVFKATIEGKSGELFVKKMPSCRIGDLAKAICRVVGKDAYPMKKVGIRPGEKMHEVLVSEEEMRRVVESETHFIILPQTKTEKVELVGRLREYTSNNARMLTEDELIHLLRKEKLV